MNQWAVQLTSSFCVDTKFISHYFYSFSFQYIINSYIHSISSHSKYLTTFMEVNSWNQML